MRYRINQRKDTDKMSETRSMVKCILGFLLAIVIIVGGIFGLDIKVDVEDAETSLEETVVDKSEFIGPPEAEETVVEENKDNAEQTEEDEKDTTSTETAPVEDETTDAVNSADTEVAEPTEEETTATEGDVENA